MRQGVEKLFDLELVECFGQVAFDARQGEGLAHVGVQPPRDVQVTQENLDGHEHQLDRPGGEPPFLKAGEVFGDERQRDAVHRFDGVRSLHPSGEAFERTPHGKLVVVGKSALGGEVADELLDFRVHVEPTQVLHPQTRPQHGRRRPNAQGIHENQNGQDSQGMPTAAGEDKSRSQGRKLKQENIDREGIVSAEQHNEGQPQGKVRVGRIFIDHNLPPSADG